ELRTVPPLPPDFAWLMSGGTRPWASSPDGQTWVMPGGQAGKVVSLLDWQTGEVRGSTPRFTATVGAVAWSPDGRFVAVGEVDGHVSFWEVPTMKPLRQLPGPSFTPTTTLAFSSDGRRLAAGSGDGLVTCGTWPLARGCSCSRRTLNGSGGWPSAATARPSFPAAWIRRCVSGT